MVRQLGQSRGGRGRTWLHHRHNLVRNGARIIRSSNIGKYTRRGSTTCDIGKCGGGGGRCVVGLIGQFLSWREPSVWIQIALGSLLPPTCGVDGLLIPDFSSLLYLLMILVSCTLLYLDIVGTVLSGIMGFQYHAFEGTIEVKRW